ncbi:MULTISPECIES: AAA family ATPase [Enterobacterales]|uniref:AAA family ATPase n=1 Tax=Enterobacterales TaxID=91347 RepID=UPI000495431F|nr:MULTISPECIES: AAA family ATPase [Enterobacterales]ELK7436468.1 AAA family ATPase [Citrobacter braakii]MBG1822330.1 AAA family ATPase [Klebsiella pneumoniae]MBG1864984.1 AAA family ATPase [Klebsiella pneumoniae]MBY0694119.1 ATP-binding protein [Klebsiella sp. M621]MDM3409712.1 ATP-binding protein [Citrobacter sp. Cb022]
MAIVDSVQFNTWHGNLKHVELLHPERELLGRGFEMTLITGENGSYKSTLLNKIVSDLVINSKSVGNNNDYSQQNPVQLLCISGSLADRFPQKELSSGVHTAFDVPHYTYFGQRIFSNLLSKKAPLETMLSYALCPSRIERYKWQFFSAAHRYAGINPSIKYIFSSRVNKRQELANLRNEIERKTPESDSSRASSRSLPDVSYATAQWLLAEFSHEEFRSLEYLLTAGKRKVELTIDSDGPHCSQVSPNVLRLGLLTDLLSLSEVKINTICSGETFSIYELSSGEFHMFSTIMGIGFTLVDSAVLLIDEPENNLHPQWQRDLMSSIYDICEEVMSEGHLIVSTHSPLIVSSALEGCTLVDLTDEEAQLRIVRYGASSDELLLSQFGVGSSRNRVVVDTVQRAISFVERGDFNNPEFELMTPKLQFIRDSLTQEDPMIDIINALLEKDSM